jgi:hypothetical protein
MPKSLRIIVSGQIAQYPLGGVTWFYLQYILGLRLLGHDVYYIEDSGQWPYNPKEDGLTKDCALNIKYLSSVMARFGLEDKWAYCFPRESQWFGLSEHKRKEAITSADLLINVSGTLERPEKYREVHRLAFIDTDPVFTQVKLARGQEDFRRIVDSHDVHFSYGECLSDGPLSTGHNWRPTRTPIVLSEWNPGQQYRKVFTTVMNWTSYNSVSFRGKTYAQKDVEIKRFLDLPHLVRPSVIEIAIGSGKNQRTPYDLLRHKGWHLVNPAEVCPDLNSFRHYTQSSMAEWSVAKNGYVEGQSGWFSERSARYLAAGRPVVVQDTGFSKVLPVGKGILPFTTIEESVSAIHKVELDYARHSKAAREIAVDHFDSTKVLHKLIEDSSSSKS